MDAIGVLRILEAIRILGLEKKTKIYQASTSELYGMVQETPQNENTPFYPRSPYGVAKLYAFWIIKNYREAYDLFAVNGILFNHESPLRGETFLTRKVTRAVARIKLGLQDRLIVGNLEGMWLMLQHNEPEDFVLATGKTFTVRYFIENAFSHAGIDIVWKGKGEEEQGLDKSSGKVLVQIDPKYYRPTEVDLLVGDPSKAQEKLNWQHNYNIQDLISEMVDADIELFKRDKYLLDGGHTVLNYNE